MIFQDQDHDLNEGHPNLIDLAEDPENEHENAIAHNDVLAIEHESDKNANNGEYYEENDVPLIDV